MGKYIFFILLTFMSVLLFCNNKASQPILRLATTTSTYETGLLDHIIEPFEKTHHLKVHIISTGTGKAIRLGENGDVDIILVHAREAEDAFVSNGYGVNRRDVMYNDFIIVGPEEDPADVGGLANPTEVFKKIYHGGFTFVSRGDDSGTHKKELLLWSLAGLRPGEDHSNWYLESGQGQAATLRIADEKNGYVLIDRGTFLFHQDKVRLKILVEGGKELFNPYGIIAVSPYRFPQVQYENAMALISWMTSPACQEMIANFRVNGNILFHKNAVTPTENK